MNSAGIVENGEDHEATRALIGSMTQNRQTPTPMRTPRYQDSLIREAQINLALQNSGTPLLGEEDHTYLGGNSSNTSVGNISKFNKI